MVSDNQRLQMQIPQKVKGMLYTRFANVQMSCLQDYVEANYPHDTQPTLELGGIYVHTIASTHCNRTQHGIKAPHDLFWTWPHRFLR